MGNGGVVTDGVERSLLSKLLRSELYATQSERLKLPRCMDFLRIGLPRSYAGTGTWSLISGSLMPMPIAATITGTGTVSLWFQGQVIRNSIYD